MKRLSFVGALAALTATFALPVKIAAATQTAARAPVATMTIREALKANGIKWEVALAKSLGGKNPQVYGFTLNHEWAAVNDASRMAAAEARAKEYAAYRAGLRA